MFLARYFKLEMFFLLSLTSDIMRAILLIFYYECHSCSPELSLRNMLRSDI